MPSHDAPTLQLENHDLLSGLAERSARIEERQKSNVERIDGLEALTQWNDGRGRVQLYRAPSQ